MTDKHKAIVLFDGDCKLCNGSVQFIEKRDKYNRFKFVSLQSDKADELLADYGLNAKDYNSVLLVSKGKILTRSTAVINIARYLSGLWPLLYGLIVIPKFIRDPVYNLIANKRHKWFGRLNV
jgi:predicted DCC family thiol-disulfide oxidoreductase YuxK